MRWLALFLLALLSATTSAQTLSLGYSESDREPFYVLQEGNLVGGFFFDFGQELGKQLGVPVVFKPYARKRIQEALANAEIDILPYENPAWAADPGRFIWSKPYFIKESQILLPKNHVADVASSADLVGMRVGTILGYYYPTLDPEFAAGRIQRDDVTILEQNVEKLKAGRIDALIASKNELDWLVGVQSDQFKRGSWVADSSPVSIAISREATPSPERILRALDLLQKQGTIQKIWAKYQH
jgi:polar amino acid transport system substrate-binding protein